MQTRREFARTVGLGAIGLGLAPTLLYARQTTTPFPPVKDPRYRNWSDEALREAKRLGCTYADIRFTLNRSNGIAVRNGRLTTAGNIGFGQFGDEDTYGFGVRVIHSGVWGFASSPIVSPEEIKRIVGIATDVAKASADGQEVRRAARAGQGVRHVLADADQDRPVERAARGQASRCSIDATDAHAEEQGRRCLPTPRRTSTTNGSSWRRRKGRSSSRCSTTPRAA